MSSGQINPNQLDAEETPELLGDLERDQESGCCAVYVVNEERVNRVRDAMLGDAMVQEVAEIFKVVAHPSRLRIVRALAREELCVCDLAYVLGMTISAVSHQLRTLRAMRMVQYRTEGKLAYYRLTDPLAHQLVEQVLSRQQIEVAS